MSLFTDMYSQNFGRYLEETKVIICKQIRVCMWASGHVFWYSGTHLSNGFIVEDKSTWTLTDTKEVIVIVLIGTADVCLSVSSIPVNGLYWLAFSIWNFAECMKVASGCPCVISSKLAKRFSLNLVLGAGICHANFLVHICLIYPLLYTKFKSNFTVFLKYGSS